MSEENRVFFSEGIEREDGGVLWRTKLRGIESEERKSSCLPLPVVSALCHFVCRLLRLPYICLAPFIDLLVYLRLFIVLLITSSPPLPPELSLPVFVPFSHL